MKEELQLVKKDVMMTFCLNNDKFALASGIHKLSSIETMPSVGIEV